jgi:hypothetical protein
MISVSSGSGSKLPRLSIRLSVFARRQVHQALSRLAPERLLWERP